MLQTLLLWGAYLESQTPKNMFVPIRDPLQNKYCRLGNIIFFTGCWGVGSKFLPFGTFRLVRTKEPLPCSANPTGRLRKGCDSSFKIQSLGSKRMVSSTQSQSKSFRRFGKVMPWLSHWVFFFQARHGGFVWPWLSHWV